MVFSGAVRKDMDGKVVLEIGKGVATTQLEGHTQGEYKGEFFTLVRLDRRPRGKKVYRKVIAQFFTVRGLESWIAAERTKISGGWLDDVDLTALEEYKLRPTHPDA